MKITPHDFLEEAMETLRSGRATDAFAIVEAGLALEPSFPGLNQLSGILLLQAGHLEAALLRLELAWDGEPADPNMALNYAQALMTAHRLTEAEEVLRSGILHSPENGLLLLRAAELAEIRGDHVTTIQYSQRACRIDPVAAEATALLARAFIALEASDDAKRVLEDGIKAHPSHLPLLVEQAKLAFSLGDKLGAAAALDHAIGAGLENVTAYFFRGNLFLDNGAPEAALDAYRSALALDPQHASSHFNSGHALLQLNRDVDALDCYRKAYNADPSNIDALFNIGTLSNGAHRYDEAITAFSEILRTHPDHKPARNNRAHAYRRMKLYSEALNDYDYLVRIDPKDEKSHYNIAVTLIDLKDFDNALKALNQALLLKPDYLDALVACGLTLYEVNNYPEALISFNKAITISPLFGDARLNRGHLRRLMNDFKGAIEDYEVIIKEKMPYRYVLGDLLYCKMQICDWDGLKDLYNEIEAGIRSGQKVATPFALLSYCRSAEVQKICAEIYCQNEFPLRMDIDPPETPSKKDRIRIGYFSADFHDHATMHLMAGLFEEHDRGRFETYAFSFGPVKKDAMRARAEAAFDHFVEASELSDKAIALLARHFEIDIAIDLKGFTTHSRAGIFSYRAAPIQINYLGYPGSMGADFIDYIIADDVIIPQVYEQFYTEKVIRLPVCYQVNDSKRVRPDLAVTREQLGLPADAFVFCGFNNNFKITPEMFDVWCRLLHKVEGSVLWLLADNEAAAANLRRAAAARGVDPSRLVFAPRLRPEYHLARHAAADLFLDCFPCSAHTTASDALFAGLPLITLIGDTFASRVAASLLTSVGLSELIANNLEEYEEKALFFTRNTDLSETLKYALRRTINYTALYNTANFARSFEDCLLEVYRRERPS